MTDLEITKLCAEAMGYQLSYEWHFHFPPGISVGTGKGDLERYNPLHDDVQCMALVKRLGLNVEWIPESAHMRARWLVSTRYASAAETDLNRAVCSCVAQMQAAKVAVTQPA